MATTALTIAGERWLDEVCLSAVSPNVNGDLSEFFTLPPGFGDCALMELFVDVSAIATLMVNPELAGPRATIVSTSSQNVDIIGVERWVRTSATALSGYLSPDPLVLWHQDERLNVAMVETDTNAVPTADVFVLAKVVRVRPLKTAPGPVRLVR